MGMVAVKDEPVPWTATLVTARPLTKVTYLPPASPSGIEKAAFTPAASGEPLLDIRAGKALNGRGVLVDGQETMKLAARVKTGLGERGV